MFPVVVVYLGLAAAFVGSVSVIKPLGLVAIHSRLQALAVIVAGLVLVIIGGSLPARETRISPPRNELDRLMPVYQFNEFHSIRIAAPREKVYGALKQVTAEEILFFRTLVWIRRLGRAGEESILNPPPNTPLLAVATRTSFLLLAEEPNQEYVVGTLVAAPRGWRPGTEPTAQGFKALLASGQPGFAPALMNFHLEDCEGPKPASPPCTLLTTETRIHATDASTRRAFARYWRIIYPGSSLIRAMWLRAIRKRAESLGS
jgi:hypothetical protein